MKKTLFALAAAIAASVALHAAEDSKDLLLQLFNARLAENPRRFAEAAREVADDAQGGMALQQFAIALVADWPDMPADVLEDLPEETLARYRANRSKIELAAKNRGNPFAWYMLALDAKDHADAIRCLRKAVERNNEQALNELGIRLVTSANAALGAAYDELNRLAESGAGAEALKAARGKAASAKNRFAAAQREATGYFRRAADKADANGCYNYGMSLLKGRGCKPDTARGLEFLRLAAKDGQPQAMSAVGECYRDGVGCARDPVAAAASFKQSCDLGNPNGQLGYALALLVGDGVEADQKAAVALLRKAADRWIVEAMRIYAKCLLDGVGFDVEKTDGLVSPELDEALERNKSAAAKRDHEAVAWLNHCASVLYDAPSMTLLADCMRDGRGVDRREAAAVYWYYRAAMGHGYAPAMVKLAECCEDGLGGLVKSHEDALWWRTKARAVEGDRMARIWLSSHEPGRFDKLPDGVWKGR